MFVQVERPNGHLSTGHIPFNPNLSKACVEAARAMRCGYQGRPEYLVISYVDAAEPCEIGNVFFSQLNVCAELDKETEQVLVSLECDGELRLVGSYKIAR